jgi:acyl carrier protein
MSDAELKARVKSMLVESLMLKMPPEDIADDLLLFSSEGLALDSIDALELAVAIEKHFAVPTPSAEVARHAFACVTTIVDFIKSNQAVS